MEKFKQCMNTYRQVINFNRESSLNILANMNQNDLEYTIYSNLAYVLCPASILTYYLYNSNEVATYNHTLIKNKELSLTYYISYGLYYKKVYQKAWFDSQFLQYRGRLV